MFLTLTYHHLSTSEILETCISLHNNQNYLLFYQQGCELLVLCVSVSVCMGGWVGGWVRACVCVYARWVGGCVCALAVN